MFRPLLTLLGVLVLALVPSARGQDAKAVAQSVLDRGAEAFEAKDAEYIAGSFAADGRLILISRDSGSAALKEQEFSGRNQLLDQYERLLTTDKPVRATNKVEYARMMGPDLLLIGGTFELSTGGDPMRLPFVQLRVKQADRWLVKTMQVYVLPAD